MGFFNKSIQFSIKKSLLLLVFGFLMIQFAACTIIRQPMPEQFPGFDRSEVKSYFMKQKIWTVGDQFIVKNQFGRPIFSVKGKIFTLGDRLKLFNMEGEELLYIKQKLFSLTRKYKIYKDRRLYAQIKKKLTLFKNRYVIDIEGPDDYSIIGDLFNYHYDIFFRGRKVASISKKIASFTDKYRINIVPGEDDPLIIAAAVVIDMISHKNEHHNIID